MNSKGGSLIKDVDNFDGGKGLCQKIGKNGLICNLDAITVIVPGFVWARLFWTPKNLVPDKFGPIEIQSLHENQCVAFSFFAHYNGQFI